MITKTINDLSVVYTGHVEVSYIDKVDGKQKIIRQKNSGKIGLFTAITRFLAGESSRDFIPSYIKGFYTSNSSVVNEAFTQRIPYNSSPTLTLNESAPAADLSSNRVTYSFLIPYACLSQTSEPISKLQLFNNKDQVCAELELGENNQISTNVSSNIIVKWSLMFDNPTVPVANTTPV